MNFGEKLRQLRNEQGLTQPELAEAVGIEQSYLSKLETGKSIPSAEVFGQILGFFSCDIGDLVDDLDQRSRLQLRQIPVVSNYFSEQRDLIIGSRRRWLFVACISVAIGTGLFYAGYSHLFVPEKVYQYRSAGIVLDGESKDIFSREIPRTPLPPDLYPDAAARTASLVARLDEDFFATREYKGTVFNIPVDGGSRTYNLASAGVVSSWVNKGVSALGLMLASFGLVLLAVERKLARFQ